MDNKDASRLEKTAVSSDSVKPTERRSWLWWQNKKPANETQGSDQTLEDGKGKAMKIFSFPWSKKSEFNVPDVPESDFVR